MNTRAQHKHTKKTCWSVLINIISNIKISRAFIWYLLLSNQLLLANTQKNDDTLISDKSLIDERYDRNHYYFFQREGCFSKNLPPKAFLITGGTKANRELRYRMLLKEDNYASFADYRSENEIAIIFSDKSSDFKGMTFEKAKQIAGDTRLGSEFTTTSKSGCEYGIIDISDWEPYFALRNYYM